MIAKGESLNESFEYTGIWFRPEFPNMEIHGTMHYTRGKITLRTTGSLDGDNNNFITQLQTMDRNPRLMPIVLGLSTDGKQITLTNCILVGANLSMGGLGVFRYRANVMYIGAHFQNINEMKFSSISIQYSNLYVWMCQRPFQTDLSRMEEHIFRLEYHAPEIIRVPIDSQFTLEIVYSNTIPMPMFEEDFDITQKVLWRIKSEESTTLDKFLEIHRCFRYFLMLAMLKTVHPLSITATNSNNQDNVIIVFPSIRIYEDVPTISMPNDMLFPFPVISNNFEAHLKSWFELWTRMSHTLTTYFATLLESNNTTIEIQFQHIALVLESYHREKYPNELAMPEAEYTAMIEDMKTKLSENQREVSFINRFKKQGNGPNLEQRLRQLVDANPHAFNNAVQEKNQFALNVMNTRNYHAHGTEDLRERAMTNVHDLVYLTYQMMALMDSCLLNEIPFPEGVRNELIIKNRNVRNYAREHRENPDTA